MKTGAQMPRPSGRGVVTESLKEVTRDFLNERLASLKSELVAWMFGTVVLGVVATHFWK